MWIYYTGSDAPTQSDMPNIFLYDYQSGRAGQCAVDYLEGYTGYFQVDSYVEHEKIAATLACSWANARRKFKES